MTYRSKRRTRSVSRRRARFAKHSDGAGAIDKLRVKGVKKLLDPHEIKTNVAYKQLSKVGNPNIVKFQEVSKRSGKVPVLANKGYNSITTQIKSLIAGLANLQDNTSTARPNDDSFSGTFTGGMALFGYSTAFSDDLYDGLSPIHREKVDKRLEKMMTSPLGRKLSDTDWDDIFVDVGIVQRRVPGQTEYFHSDVKATALEIIDKFAKTQDENGVDNVPNLNTPEYMSFINNELKDLRNDLIRGSKDVTDTPAVLRGDVLTSNFLKTGFTGAYAGLGRSIRVNVGLANNTDRGAQQIIDLIMAQATSIVDQTPKYVADMELDTTQYQDGRKRRGSRSRKSRSKRSKHSKKHSARDGRRSKKSKGSKKRRSRRRM